jgi:hypothetical protein
VDFSHFWRELPLGKKYAKVLNNHRARTGSIRRGLHLTLALKGTVVKHKHKMLKSSLAQLLFSLILFFRLSSSLQAVIILSDPSFSKAPNAPLAGTLQFSTDVPTRLTVSVTDGTETWKRDFFDYSAAHSLPLFGFKPGRTNIITLTVRDRFRNEFTPDHPITFVTEPLPDDFPNIIPLHTEPSKMEPGYTLFRVEVHNNTYAYVVIVDSSGEVVWYNSAPSTADVRQLPNGNLFMPATNRFVEMNLLGETLNNWFVPADLPIDPHDGVVTDHGTILYLSTAYKMVSDYPTSATNPSAPLATANVRYEKVVELSVTNATPINIWTPIDLLDPRRISYFFAKAGAGWDSF